jgi:hypothetical protein
VQLDETPSHKEHGALKKKDSHLNLISLAIFPQLRESHDARQPKMGFSASQDNLRKTFFVKYPSRADGRNKNRNICKRYYSF